MAGLEDMSKVRMVRIRNTLSLGEILVSESLLGEVEGHPYIKVQGAAENIKFTEKGDLF